MSNLLDKLNKDIIANPQFIQERDELFHKYVKYLIGSQEEIERNLVKNIASTAQLFYKSKNKEFKKEGAILLAILLDIAGNEYADLIPIAINLFIESGDFPNLSLLRKRHPNIKMDFGFYTDAKFNFKEDLNSVKELAFPLTDFQRLLWENLESDEDVITVAPTSAGKTHIILTYLVKKVAFSEAAFAVIVVPTRALISEVSNKVYEIAKSFKHENEIEICTVPKDSSFQDKTIFVMTQERLYEVIQSGDLSFNYLFIDEAHNISDMSRGVLLHLTLEKLLENSYPQIIISMPSESYKNAFISVFNDVNFHKEITQHSPVAKILISVRLAGRNIEISRYGINYKVKIPKIFTGTNLADIVLRLGKGQSNIIYKNQTNYCESTASDIADRITDYSTNSDLEEAADYIEQFIHEGFSLAMTLRKGVAFHYGPLPSSVRVMVERLVKEGFVNYIVCTSTLAEGVNLPAKNLFLQNPAQPIRNQPSERLEDVKINNITGRAGRMVEHFSGNIFLIEPEEWMFKDYFENKDHEEDKIPSYFKTLNEELDKVIAALSGNYPHSDPNQYRFYTIANKLIKEFSNGSLESSLNSQELTLSNDSKTELVEFIKHASNSLNIAPFTLQANPTIGYIQQNKLFDFLGNLDNFDEWVLPHPKSSDLYLRLKNIIHKLNEFGVYISNDGYSIEYIALIASKWVLGKSLKEIISDQIAWDNEHENSNNINRSVRNVIKVINNDIRFRLTNALSCYHLLLTNQMRLKSIQKASVKIHMYLEIGACDERMINLINFGLSRESAKEIDEKISHSREIRSISELALLLSAGELNNLHPITRKEIRTLTG